MISVEQDLLFPNLVIEFPKTLGTFLIDPNGNLVENAESFKVFASVKRSSAPNFYRMPGIGQSDISLKGKIVEKNQSGFWTASLLPKFVTLESEGYGTLTFGQETFKGRFKFLPIIQSRFPEIYNEFGARIRGYLNVYIRN